MLVFHELDTHIDKYDIEGEKRHKEALFESWYELMPKIVGRLQTDQTMYFLLDERYFDYFTFQILFTANEPFDISQMKELLNEKIAHVKYTTQVHSPYITHRIVNAQVDDEESNYLIWKTGQLKFDLQLFFLKPDAVTTFKIAQWERFFEDRRITMYPRSLCMIDYLAKHIHKEQFGMLYIWEDSCQLILIKQNSYQDVHYLNMGVQLLKACYAEHDIEKYFWSGTAEIQQNAFLKKLIEEWVQFFTDNLCQWLRQYLPAYHDLVLISDVNRNEIFVERFQASYREAINGFVLPCPTISGLPTDQILIHESNVAATYLAAKWPKIL